MKFNSAAKRELVDHVVADHLSSARSRNPVTFAFLTRTLSELRWCQTPIISVQKDAHELSIIEYFGAREHTDFETFDGEVVSFKNKVNGQQVLVIKGDLLEELDPVHNILDDVREGAVELSCGTWPGNGLTAIWYDSCCIFDNSVAGLMRLRYACNNIIKQIPFCMTYSNARHYCPHTVEEANDRILSREQYVDFDYDYESVISNYPQKAHGFWPTIHEIYDYIGDNGAKMAIAVGTLDR